MRITDQYLWNVVFTIIFVGVTAAATIILETGGMRPLWTLSFLEVAILSLATFRLTRLFVYDAITAFFREQFWDLETGLDGATKLKKPTSGPRRTLADLLSCPWCVGLWAGAAVTFCYYISPIFWYPILFLAIAGVGSFVQVLANMIGWRAEHLKQKVEE